MEAMTASLVEPMAADAREGELSPPVHIDTTAEPTMELSEAPPRDVFLLRDTVRLLDVDGDDERGAWAPRTIKQQISKCQLTNILWIKTTNCCTGCPQSTRTYQYACQTLEPRP
eukprot:SAG11_NODE_9874_length_873_cov_1.458656_1_plen_114_part_00